MDPIAAATKAIQGIGPNQAAATPSVNTAMPAGFNANGTMAPVSSAAPTTLPQTMPELNNLFNVQQASTLGRINTGAAIGQANIQANNANNLDYYNFQNQRMQALVALNNYQQQQNPANYQRTQSQDGGYNFTDGTGKPITAWKYAQSTGQDVAAVLKGSKNPTDQQYIQDETNLNAISNAWASGDKSAINKAATQAGFTDEAHLQSALQQAGINNPQDLLQQFMRSYPNIWGGGQGTSVGNARGAGTTFNQPNAPSTFF